MGSTLAHEVLVGRLVVSTAMRWLTGGSASLQLPTPALATAWGAIPSRLAPLSSQFFSSK